MTTSSCGNQTSTNAAYANKVKKTLNSSSRNFNFLDDPKSSNIIQVMNTSPDGTLNINVNKIGKSFTPPMKNTGYSGHNDSNSNLNTGSISGIKSIKGIKNNNGKSHSNSVNKKSKSSNLKQKLTSKS